jgi:hypothetical protein
MRGSKNVVSVPSASGLHWSWDAKFSLALAKVRDYIISRSGTPKSSRDGRVVAAGLPHLWRCTERAGSPSTPSPPPAFVLRTPFFLYFGPHRPCAPAHERASVHSHLWRCTE